MRLSAHDASFLYTETASGPMHSITLTVLDGPATYEQILQYYADRIHLVPRLRQKVAFIPFNIAHPKWVDDEDFDLTNHLKSHDVPPNTTLQRATEIALELGEPLLDRSRPLWLTYVLENVEGKTLVAQAAHHAFVDGATAVALSTALTDPQPNAPPPDKPPEWKPARLPAPAELWQEAMQENAQAGFAQIQSASQNVQTATELMRKGASLMQRMTRPVMQASWNAGMVGPKRKFATVRYELNDFKPIRKALGGTVNDIVLTVVSEAAARYLKEKGEQVDNQYLRLMCPVDVRDENVDPMDMSGNRVSAMFPVVAAWPMPILERFAQIHAELNEIKCNEEPWVLDQLQQLQPNLPPVAMAQSLTVGTAWDITAAAARAPAPVMPTPEGTARLQQLGFNFTCTNIPGPNWTQYLAGYRVVQSVGTLMLGGNLGFGCCIVSFDGKIMFGFTADPRLMPDLNRFRDLVAETFAELQQAAQTMTKES